MMNLILNRFFRYNLFMVANCRFQTYDFISHCKKAAWLVMVCLMSLAPPRSYAEVPSKSFKKVESLAILGDSLSTGAGTHPNISFDAKIIWDIFDGRLSLKPVYDEEFQQRLGLSYPISTPERPTILWKSLREFQSGVDWLGIHTLQSIARLFLNTEEFSWGYLLGLKLKVAPKDIVMASENGAKMQNLRAQVDRVLDHVGDKPFPQVIAILYNGNDLCAQNYDLMTSDQLFEDQLFNGLIYLARNAIPNPNGTNIVLPSYINVSQLINDKDLLAKKVNAHGSMTTCETLRKERFLTNIHKLNTREGINPLAPMLSQYVPPNPNSICPTIFGPAAGKDENMTKLASQIRLYRRAQKRAVERAEEHIAKNFADKKITISIIDATAKWKFKAEEIGPDCFHLSRHGQLKLAELLFAELQKD